MILTWRQDPSTPRFAGLVPNDSTTTLCGTDAASWPVPRPHPLRAGSGAGAG